jgi:membrane protein
LFSLIPYLPLHELRDELHALLSYLPGAPPPQPDATVREELLNLLERGLPGDAFLLIRDTVHNLLTQKRGGLLSFGVGASIFFAANGLYGLMQAFNEEDTRHFVVRRLLSVGLTVGLGILVLVALSLLIAGRFILDFLFELGFIHDMVTYLGLMAFRLVSAMAVLFLVIGVLQYYTASPGTRLRVFSPGAFLSTVLILLTSWGFSWYVENFAQYSKFYGSLGTPVIIMLWIYLNAYALLVGYEFNASVVIFRRELQRGGNTESAEARLEERLAP